MALCRFRDGAVENGGWEIPKQVVEKVCDGVCLGSLENAHRRDHDACGWGQDEASEKKKTPKERGYKIEVV